MAPEKDAVVVDGVFKAYRVYAAPSQRLRRLAGLSSRHLDFEALHDVSFTVPRGEALGIIGENGAGKSTLLKIIAGTTRPTLGAAHVNGVVAAILELGAAFHPEFTGRENAVLYGALLGLERSEMLPRLGAILDFAELGEFIDHPLKSYSTGMGMRLAFAVATHVDPDVLVIDEALAVGDGYFQKKCVDKILDIKGRGATILFCSHAMYYVSMFCDRALWLRQGRVEKVAGATSVVEAYESYLLTREKRRLGDQGSAQPVTVGAKVGRISRLEVVGLKERTLELEPGARLTVEIEVQSVRAEEAFHVGIALDTLDGRCALGVSTTWDRCEPLQGRERYTVRLDVPQLPLASGTFHLSAFLLDDTGLHVHDQVVLPEAVRVSPPQWTPSLLAVAHSWELE